MVLRLRAERLRRGWSQLDLALRSGLHPVTISKLERGREFAYSGQRAKLARVFGLPADELFREVPGDGEPGAR